MEDLPLGRIATLVPEFAVKDLPLGRTLMMIYIYIYRGEGWLWFPEIWSGQTQILMELIFNPSGEFCEVRRTQLTKATLFTFTLVPLGSFQLLYGLFRCWTESGGVESNSTYSSLVKLQPTFLSLKWKTCLWAELQPWCLSLQWRTCPWAEHSDIYIYIYIYIYCGKQREATASVQSLVKLQPWFLSLRWKTCLVQNWSLDSCAYSEGPAIG